MEGIKPYLTRCDIGKLLDLDRAEVTRLLAEEGLPLTRLGGRIVVSTEAWTRWVLRVNEAALRAVASQASD